MYRSHLALISAFFVITCMTVSAAYAEPSREQATAELEEVRDDIKGLRKAVERDGRRRSSAEKELAKVEQEEQAARRELASVRKRLEQTKAEQRELERQLASHSQVPVRGCGPPY